MANVTVASVDFYGLAAVLARKGELDLNKLLAAVQQGADDNTKLGYSWDHNKKDNDREFSTLFIATNRETGDLLRKLQPQHPPAAHPR